MTVRPGSDGVLRVGDELVEPPLHHLHILLKLQQDIDRAADGLRIQFGNIQQQQRARPVDGLGDPRPLEEILLAQALDRDGGALASLRRAAGPPDETAKIIMDVVDDDQALVIREKTTRILR